MKGSKLVLVLVIVITVVLGGIAVWIGIKLSKQKEIEELPVTGAGDNYYYCNFYDGACSTGHDSFYARRKDTDAGSAPCMSKQKDKAAGGAVTNMYGPDVSRQHRRCEAGVSCDCEPGYDGDCWKDFDTASCQSCENIQIVGNPSRTGVTIRAYSFSYIPSIKCITEGPGNETDVHHSIIERDASKVEFRFRLYSGNTMIAEKLITQNDTLYSSIECAKTPNPTSDYEWGEGGRSVSYGDYLVRDKVYECHIEYNWDFSSSPLADDTTYRVEVSSRQINVPDINADLTWRQPDMIISVANGTTDYDIPYQIDTNGDGQVDPGPYTYRQLYNSRIVPGYFQFADDLNNTCIKSFSFGAILTEDLACDNLTASPTTLTTAGGEITLTARATAQNVTISNYNYGSDLNESSLEDGATTSTWTIPAGTAAGEYHAWVSVNGGSLTNIGCTGRDTCSRGGERCQVTLTVQNAEENLVCQDLASSVDLSGITEDDIRTGNLSTNLTTTISTTNVTINPTNGYSYYTNVPHARFGSDTSDSTIPYANGSNPLLIIPQNTPNGSYYISVMVNGTGASGAVQSGCDSGTHCTGGGDSCLLNFSIGEGTCNCEGVTRSPSGNEITAGSLVSYIMTAGDQNGNDCLVDASNVNWTTTGTPSLVTQNREPEPISGITDEAVQHHIIYEIPSAASSGSEYCVSSGISGLSQVEACRNCFTIGGQPVPAFAAVKTSEMVCINNNTAARITYTIQVRNISEVAGVLEYVEDTYDSRFESSWVSNITPTPDSHSGNVIRWDNNDQGYTLEANDGVPGGNDETEFSYIVTVPSAYFGTYEDGEFVPNQFRNHAIVKPEDQEEIELSTIVRVICLARTGLFNNAVTLSIVGLLFLIIGIVLFRLHEYTYIYLSPGEKFIIQLYKKSRKGIRNGINEIREGINDRLHLTEKERFEKRSIKKVEKKLGKI